MQGKSEVKLRLAQKTANTRHKILPRFPLCSSLLLSLGLLNFPMAPQSQALTIDTLAGASLGGMKITPVVVFGKQSRRTIAAFAQEEKLNPVALQKAFAGAGLIECGAAHGAGQLTLVNNLITTAAHVFFDEKGKPRAKTCNFVIEQNGKQVSVPVDLSTIVAGSTDPYALPAVHDWAVAKLSHSIDGVIPFELADTIKPNEPVEFVARGHIDWGEGRQLSIEKCSLHDQLAASEEGNREFSFDCETGDGASGGAVVVAEAEERPVIGAILVGWRSNKPFHLAPFSSTHYNFVVSIEGAFKKAVLAAAEQTIAASKLVLMK